MKKYKNYDWATIQKYYDEGNSLRDVTATFGPANRTIRTAINKGLFKQRKNYVCRKGKVIDRTRPPCANDNCQKLVSYRYGAFCSHSCHKHTEYETYVHRWIAGLETGSQEKWGTLANFARRYIKEINENKCSKCGWCEVNERTGLVPVQVDHVDGDPMNNAFDNLRLLCPNCHSLTPTWGCHGHGRPGMTKVYIKK